MSVPVTVAARFCCGAPLRFAHDGAYGWTALRFFFWYRSGRQFRALGTFDAGLGGWWTPQAQGLFAAVESGQVPIYLQLDLRRAL
ncbi:MAG: hypothetical protein QM756_05840 [Polyangiaceae bacterium]